MAAKKAVQAKKTARKTTAKGAVSTAKSAASTAQSAASTAKGAAPKKKAAPTPVAAKAVDVPTGQPADNIDAIGKIQLTLTAELGRTRDTIGTVREYGDQSLIELDRTVGDPVDILLNGEIFARGEVVTVGENFGVRITEIISRPGD